jgi:hypothetical protein
MPNTICSGHPTKSGRAEIPRLISNAPVEAIESWLDRIIDAQQLSDIFKDDL